MTPQEQRNKRFDEKFKCIQSDCDGNGCIPHQVAEDEWEAEQCQFHAEYLFPIKSHITSEVHLTIEQVEKWVEGRRMPVDKPDEDVSANALAEIFETKLEAFDYSTNSFIDDLLTFLKELKK